MTIQNISRPIHPLLLGGLLVLPTALIQAQSVYPERDAEPDLMVTEPRGVTPDPGQNIADEVVNRPAEPNYRDIPGQTVADRLDNYRWALDEAPEKPVTDPRGATPRPGINRDVVQ